MLILFLEVALQLTGLSAVSRENQRDLSIKEQDEQRILSKRQLRNAGAHGIIFDTYYGTWSGHNMCVLWEGKNFS
jgi:hypothetical protein